MNMLGFCWFCWSGVDFCWLFIDFCWFCWFSSYPEAAQILVKPQARMVWVQAKTNKTNKTNKHQ